MTHQIHCVNEGLSQQATTSDSNTFKAPQLGQVVLQEADTCRRLLPYYKLVFYKLPNTRRPKMEKERTPRGCCLFKNIYNNGKNQRNVA